LASAISSSCGGRYYLQVSRRHQQSGQTNTCGPRGSVASRPHAAVFGGGKEIASNHR